MIICFFVEQAAMLLLLLTFKVNMSFKRVSKKKFNEIIFAKYLKTFEKRE